MKKLDLDQIMRKNPHLNPKALEALRQALERIPSNTKRHYRLAPIGTHRAIIGEPDVAHHNDKPHTKNHPGF